MGAQVAQVPAAAGDHRGAGVGAAHQPLEGHRLLTQHRQIGVGGERQRNWGLIHSDLQWDE
jgi:hypothetical protein